LDTLKGIVQTLCNSVDWEKEKPAKELSAYLLRGFYNFEKRLHSLLDDALSDSGETFDLNEHIEDYFGNSNMRLRNYLGSTSTDKKPWQHLVKVANEVNKFLIKKNLMDDSFFNIKKTKFVEAIYNLANPTSKSAVSIDEVKNYIKGYCN